MRNHYCAPAEDQAIWFGSANCQGSYLQANRSRFAGKGKDPMVPLNKYRKEIEVTSVTGNICNPKRQERGPSLPMRGGQSLCQADN